MTAEWGFGRLTGVSSGRGGHIFLLDPRDKVTLVLVIIQAERWAFPISGDFLAVSSG